MCAMHYIYIEYIARMNNNIFVYVKLIIEVLVKVFINFFCVPFLLKRVLVITYSNTIWN